MMFLNTLISWRDRGTLGNPFPSLTTSISVGSLTSRQILCSVQQAIIVEDTFSTDSSSLFSRHLHLPFNSPNACSTTTLALLRFIEISLAIGQGSGLRKQFHAPGRKFISWVSNNEWFYLGATYPTRQGMQDVAVFYCRQQ